MILPVVFRAAARRDFEDATGWYEAQRPGLGELFVEEVERAIEQCARFPFARPMAHNDLRCARVRRFPYSIVYRIEPGSLLVVAVFHARRHPGAWHERDS